MNVQIRKTRAEDAPYLTQWLAEPGILRWFPMIDQREIEDAVRIWMSYTKLHAGITAEVEGAPCGMANLYIQPFKKISHQCLFSIIVSEKMRGKGIGAQLIAHLKKMAKEEFRIEVLHLEVYAGNPAMRLYERSGFKEYGRHPEFLKEQGTYIDKILMQQEL